MSPSIPQEQALSFAKDIYNNIKKDEDIVTQISSTVLPLFLKINSLEDSLHQCQKELTELQEHVIRSRAATEIQSTIRGSFGRSKLNYQRSIEERGTMVLKKYVFKLDRFPGCHVLDTPNGDIAPNFRRLDSTPFYGGAQPTVDGIRLVLDRVVEDGYRKVLWVNLREEAVLLVKGMPYTARRGGKLNENDMVPGIEGHIIEVVENSLKEDLEKQLGKCDGRFEYWVETTLGENHLSSTNVSKDEVTTLPEYYASLKSNKPHHLEEVEYLRLPIERENAPEQDDFEKFRQMVSSASKDTAIIFNCQMGRGRTTTALNICSLAWSIKNPQWPLSSEDIHQSARKVDSIKTPDLENGEFVVILELLKRFENGHVYKARVDAVVKRCAHIVNLISSIYDSRQRSMREAKPAKRSFFLHRACNFVERYFFLILFEGYLNEQEPQKFEISFPSWLRLHSGLFRLIGDFGGVRYHADQPILGDNVLKFDHFPNIHKLPQTLGEMVPNFRRVEDLPLYGVAQCMVRGISLVLRRIMDDGYKKIVWISLREEAVIFINDRPFVVRHRGELQNNLEYPGIEVNEIAALENKLKNEVIAKIEQANGYFLYWHEPVLFKNQESSEYIVPRKHVKTLADVYDMMAQEGYSVRYARIPVSDESAPEEKDFDDIVRLLRTIVKRDPAAAQETAIICNCQMGRGRTTTGLVCIYMLLNVRKDIAMTLPNDYIYDPENPSYRRGEFFVIIQLVSILKDGVLCKAFVDKAIDKCDAMQNLRECIVQCTDQAEDRALPQEKRDFFMKRAVNYLERYFYMICFASYLREEVASNFKSLFATWMKERHGTALYDLLDNMYFEPGAGAAIHVSSMRWRWRGKRKLISRLE